MIIATSNIMDLDEYFPYVSCIRIGKQPILPPLMTEERRLEMRHYRDAAVNLEKNRKFERRSFNSDVTICSPDAPCVEKSEANKIHLSIAKDNDQTPRRSSYTLECPSPIMLQYLQSLQDNGELHTVNGELQIQMSPETYPSEMVLETKNLTLDDLDAEVADLQSPSETKDERNFSERRHSSFDMKNLTAAIENSKSSSLPNTCQPSPSAVYRTNEYISGECKKSMETNSKVCLLNGFEEDDATPKLEISPEKNESEYLTSSEKNEAEYLTSPEKNEGEYMSKSFGMSDLSMNTSHEFDVGRESVYSDCSSVSLTKFLSDKKEAENQQTESATSRCLKEQLRAKHEVELMKLLTEQEQENQSLDQFLTSLSDSVASSPKNNYAYSKDIVLKKYPVEVSPARTCSQADNLDEYSSKTIEKQTSCRRRICDPEPKGQSVVESVTVAEQNKALPDLETKMQAASKINAAVRGYFVRRLLKSSRVQLLLQTINECLITAISLQNENDLRPEDFTLQHRVLQQSIAACNEIQSIFSLPVAERMKIIAADREQMNNLLLKKVPTPLPLSAATKRTLERRKSMNTGGARTKSTVTRKRCKSVSSCDTNSSNRTTPSFPKVKTNISQNCSISHCSRRSWR